MRKQAASLKAGRPRSERVDSPYRRQVLVCTFGPWCRIEGSDLVRDAMKKAAKEAGIASELRVTKSGCLGQCGNGPMVASWPDNVWYCGVKAEDVPEIVREHLVGGRPVERLRYRPAKPGSNKTEAVLAKEKESGKVTE